MQDCPTHVIVKTQTFSLAEMEFLVAHAEEYRICESCKLHFERAIADHVRWAKQNEAKRQR